MMLISASGEVTVIDPLAGSSTGCCCLPPTRFPANWVHGRRPAGPVRNPGPGASHGRRHLFRDEHPVPLPAFTPAPLRLPVVIRNYNNPALVIPLPAKSIITPREREGSRPAALKAGEELGPGKVVLALVQTLPVGSVAPVRWLAAVAAAETLRVF